MKWISIEDKEPTEGMEIWAYYPQGRYGGDRGESVRVSVGNWMMYEMDEGQWKGLGSAGGEFTHWAHIKPPKPPEGR